MHNQHLSKYAIHKNMDVQYLLKQKTNRIKQDEKKRNTHTHRRRIEKSQAHPELPVSHFNSFQSTEMENKKARQLSRKNCIL